jgi:hypothetical protein
VAKEPSELTDWQMTEKVTMTEVSQELVVTTVISTATQLVHMVKTETVDNIISSIATQTVHMVETQVLAATTTEVVNSATTETVHMIQTETVNNVATQIATQTVTEAMNIVSTETATTTATETVNIISTVVSTQQCAGTPTDTTLPAVHITTTVTICAMCTTTVAAAASAAMTHTVTVGGPSGLIYTPSEVSAAVNDVVHFIFESQNHTATQSTFDLPCVKKQGGADSGFQPNPDNAVIPAPSWDYVVATTDPTWWFCAQSTHCGKGMVFSINANTEKTFAAFKDAAVAQNGTDIPIPPAPSSLAQLPSEIPTTLVTMTKASSAASTNTSLFTDTTLTETAVLTGTTALLTDAATATMTTETTTTAATITESSLVDTTTTTPDPAPTPTTTIFPIDDTTPAATSLPVLTDTSDAKPVLTLGPGGLAGATNVLIIHIPAPTS